MTRGAEDTPGGAAAKLGRIGSIEDVASGLSSEIGDRFLRSVAAELLRLLEADYVFIGETREEPPERVATVAVSTSGGGHENFEYDLSGAPCANVVKGDLCSYPNGVQELFPEDVDLVTMGVQAYIGAPLFSGTGEVIGLIVTLFTEAVESVADIESVLRIFAVRTEAEIERKKVEDLRRLSEERMKLAFEGSRHGFWDWDIEHDRTWFSDGFFAMLGYGPRDQDRMVTTWQGLIHEDDLRGFVESVFDAVNGENPSWEQQVRLRTKQGDYRWVSCRGRVVESDEAGNPIRAAGTNLDIDARVQAEQALRQSENRYRDLLRRIPSGIQECDADGVITFASETYERMMGFEAGGAVGKAVWEVLDDAEVGVELQAHLRYLVERQPEPEPYFARNRRAGGGVVDIRVDWDYIWGVDGEVTGFASVITDITERRTAERALRENEAQLSVIFKEMVAAFAVHEVIKDADGRGVDYRFLDVNPAFERATGLKRSDVIGRTVKEVMPNTEDYWIDRFCRVAATGSPIHFENYARELDRHFEVSAFAAGDNRFGVTFQDVTERRRAAEEKARIEADLRHSQKMEAIGNLAGGIAHDFNNILMAILGFGEIALYETADDSPAREALDEILKAGNRARDIVGRILAFSRKADDEAELVDLGHLVLEALKMLRATMPSNIEIETTVEAGSGFVWANSTQLHQVLVNLCTNAYQAMPEGGRLTLELETVNGDGSNDDPTLELIVRDSGCGMSRAEAERAFEPYFTTKKDSGGTGLGLAVVHGIVASIGGAISIASGEGDGTVVTVVLPISDGEELERVEGVVREGSALARIVFVDDEPSLARLGRWMLSSLGYRAECFDDPKAAVEFLEADPGAVDLVVADLSMPGITGLELAERMRDLENGPPIVLCTGFSELAVEERARVAGVRDFLMKPVDRKTLAEVVEKYCRTPVSEDP